MKKIIAIVLAMVMVFALVACGSTTTTTTTTTTTVDPTEAPAETETTAPVEEEAGEFVVNTCIASEPETIDPNLVSSVDGSMYTQHTFENLMKYEMVDTHPAGDETMWNTVLVKGQAADYTISDDGLVYTFTLRDDIFWSDGEPVVAQDWVYSWQRCINPATAAEYGYLMDGILLNAAAVQAGEMDPSELGIKALDDKTLEITLENPCSYFLELCGFADYVPLRQDVVEGSDNWTDPSNFVGNGPYVYTEWVHDSYIRMEKSETYYDYANLGPDAIVWWLSDSQTAILSAYQNGDYNFVEDIPTDMIASMQESGDCFANPYVGTYYLYLNVNNIPDWRVRAAMTICLDRENIVEYVTQGGQVPATGLVAAGIIDSQGNDFSTGVSELGAIYNTLASMYPDADLETYAGRCELAKDLYDAAVADGGWNPDTTIVYNFNTSDAHKAIAEACASDWETVLGLKITLANQDWNVYTNGLAEGNFGVARLGWIADFNDANTYLELFRTGNSYNYSQYSNEAYDAAIDGGKALGAGVERDAQLYAAEEMLFGEGGFPVCPIYYYTQIYCKNADITNVGFTALGYFFFQYAQKG